MSTFIRINFMENGETQHPPRTVDLPKSELKKFIDKCGNLLLYKGLLIYSTKGKRLENIKDFKHDKLYILVDPSSPYFIPKPYDEIFSNYIYLSKIQSRAKPASRNVGYSSRTHFTRPKVFQQQYSPTIRELRIGQELCCNNIPKLPKYTQTSEHSMKSLVEPNSKESIQKAQSRTSNLNSIAAEISRKLCPCCNQELKSIKQSEENLKKSFHSLGMSPPTPAPRTIFPEPLKTSSGQQIFEVKLFLPKKELIKMADHVQKCSCCIYSKKKPLWQAQVADAYGRFQAGNETQVMDSEYQLSSSLL